MSGWGSSPPTGLLQTAATTAGNSTTMTLIPASANLTGIKLWSLSLSNIALNSNVPVQWAVIDQVADTDGNIYLELAIGLAVAGQVADAVSQDMEGIVIPAGAALQLVNAGSGGQPAYHQCSATAVYSMV